MSDNNGQITVIKRQVTKATNQAKDLVVSNQEEFDIAANLLTDIKKAYKLAEDDRTSITAPINKSLTAINARYKPFKDDLDAAEKIVKSKLGEYQTKVQADLDKKEAELRQKMASNEITPEEAVEQIENEESIGTKVQTRRGSVQFKTVRKVRVTDVTKVPAEYLNNAKVIEAITSAVRSAALDGQQIAGVEVYEEKTIAAS